ncbi:MAG: 4-hydroxythreonine-4-phosphate dehydrogenase PdxA [Pseudomonadota bacterium]
MTPSKAPLLLTPGDPRGVGPEVAVKAAVRHAGPLVLVGEGGAIRAEAARQGLALVEVERLEQVCGGCALLEPPAGSEPVEVRALRVAVEACLGGRARGLVTGPIHKARLAATGFAYPGHTDFLGALCGVPRPVMAFVGRRMRVVLATVHRPLREVPDALEEAGLLHVMRTAHAALVGDLGIPEPALVVCGLNPHAGDGGLLGREEGEVIGPACDRLRAEGMRVRGPLSAEAAARDAAEGRADMLVAMYHDQGLIPLKVLDFGHAVNWTLGLPMVRTSVDHGTADDIAGRGIADPGSMIAAIRLAERVATVRGR